MDLKVITCTPDCWLSCRSTQLQTNFGHPSLSTLTDASYSISSRKFAVPREYSWKWLVSYVTAHAHFGNAFCEMSVKTDLRKEEMPGNVGWQPKIYELKVVRR